MEVEPEEAVVSDLPRKRMLIGPSTLMIQGFAVGKKGECSILKIT